MANIIDEVAKTTIQLLLKEPFYGHFLTGVIKEVTKKVDTLAVGLTSNSTVKLYVNASFWSNVLTTADYRYGVIKHEILHIVLKHILQVKKFEHKTIFNIAADIVVNQYVHPSQLPEGAVTIDKFSDLNLEKNQDVGYYYRILLKTWKSHLASQSLKSKKPSSKNNGTGNGINNSETGQDLSKSPSIQVMEDLINQENEWLKRHDIWQNQIAKLSQAEHKILESTINGVLQQTIDRVGRKGIGHLPGNLQQYLDDFVASQKPVLDWRRALRLFAASSSRTYLKNTIRRPSRRYGTTPGIKVKPKQKLLIAIDTSGSICIKELQVFFSEIYHIWRQGAEIKVVECDVAIQAEYTYRGKPPELIHGRGGTDFNAPIAFANEKYQPDGIIYFTDGFAAAPYIQPRKPVFWMISANGITKENDVWAKLPGRKVKMPA